MSLLSDILAVAAVALFAVGLWMLHPGLVVLTIAFLVGGLAFTVNEDAEKRTKAKEPRP